MSEYFFSRVLNIIEDWMPKKKYRREAAYRDDLMAFIRKELKRGSIWGPSKKHRIRKETGRHLADIGIDGKIGIELKYNLNSKAKVDRLFGQVDDYLRGYDEMIIVLCGKTSEDSLDYLEEKIRNMPSRDMFSSTQVEIVVKDGKNRKKKDPFSLF